MKKIICLGCCSFAVLNAFCQSSPKNIESSPIQPAPSFSLPVIPLKPIAPLSKSYLPGISNQIQPNVNLVLPEMTGAGRITYSLVDNMAVLQPGMEAVEKMPNAANLFVGMDRLKKASK